MVTNNECPAGLLQMRSNFPVPDERITKAATRNAWVADCHVCDRPNTGVFPGDKRWYYRQHKQSVKIGGVTPSGKSYSNERRSWDASDQS